MVTVIWPEPRVCCGAFDGQQTVARACIEAAKANESQVLFLFGRLTPQRNSQKITWCCWSTFQNVINKMYHIWRSLPVFSHDAIRVQWVWLVCVNLSILSGREKQEDHSPNRWNYMNEFNVGCTETVFVYKLVFNIFFHPSVLCGIWQLWAAPSLSTLCSVQALCVCLTVWLRVAVLVWECQWLSVCHAVRRRVSVCNLRSRESLVTLIILIGSRTPAQVSWTTFLVSDVICWHTQVKDYVVNLFYFDLHGLDIHDCFKGDYQTQGSLTLNDSRVMWLISHWTWLRILVW